MSFGDDTLDPSNKPSPPQGQLIAKLVGIKRSDRHIGGINIGEAELLLRVIRKLREIAEDSCTNPRVEAADIIRQIDHG